ncbi:MFS transporter [Streptomyces sp. NPDC059850]|uniref:MFS transporter n=1 Tax=Streptomyces sp. NPDC059850 TaxID=3346970 RepID=UPI003655334E
MLLVVLAGNMLLDALEVSVVIVSLPAISDAFALSIWTVQWVMGGFALGFGALLLPGVRLAALFGQRRVYLAALLVFAVASLVGGLATNETLLIATRMVKGACAALTAPTGLAIITTAFREGADRNRAVAVYSFFGAIGFTTGLLLSGVLTQVSWRWTFLFAAPVALALLLFAAAIVPRDLDGTAAPVGRPLRRLLRNGPLIRSALGAATLNGTYLGLLFLATFQLQTMLGWSAGQTALAFLPACVPLAVSALASGRLVMRFGAPRLIALGAAAPLIGYALYLRSTVPVSYAADLLPTLVLVGVGFVCAFAALNMQASSALPPADRRAASALYQTAVQFGAVIMLTLVSALLSLGLPRHEEDIAAAYRPPLLLMTAVAAGGLVVAVWGLVSRTTDRAARYSG